MAKKIAVVLGSLVIVLVGVASLSAFEAWVVNVTARIENALFVHPESLRFERAFGTLFPQEYRELGFFVTFSESFSEDGQTRVSKVDYQIKQKPKCANNVLNPTDFSQVTEDGRGNFVCVNPLHTKLPLLCPYLSKTPDGHPSPGNDTGVPAFHEPDEVATGHINKFSVDVGDNWIIDLAVPCFKGECAQDWADFVKRHNPLADPKQFMADPDDDGKIFGCDLWVEVTRIY
jgi:hypothetical protein